MPSNCQILSQPEGPAREPGRPGNWRPGPAARRWAGAMAVLLLLAWATTGLAADFSLKVGDILAANYGGNSVLKIDAVSGQVQSLGTFITPTDVALTTNGHLYISEWGGSIYRLTLTNGALELVNSNTTLSSVWGMVLDPATGDLIVSCGANDSIVRVNSATGAETVITDTTNLFGVSGLAWLDPNHIVVCSTFNNLMVKVAVATGVQTVIPTVGGGLDMPRGVAVFGTNLFMTAFDSREIRRMPTSGGVVTTFYTATGVPFGMAVETNGNLITGTSGAALEVLRVSPGGGLLRSYTDPRISEITGVVVSGINVTASGLINTPPALDAIPNQSVNETTLLSFLATATDTNWPPQDLTFSLEAGAPAGAVIATDGLFSWIPAESQGPSNHLITVKVTDNGTPPLSNTMNFTIVVNEVNTRPVIGAIGNKTATAGSLLTFTATATDADLPPQALTFSLAPGAPAGAGINSTGVFSWTPTAAQAPATNLITVRVTDDGTPALTATASFTVVVSQSNVPPVLTAISNRTVTAGTPVSFQATASDANLPAQTLTFSLDPGYPTGATITGTGRFNWTPSQAHWPATNLITVRVTDNGTPPQSATASFTVVVNHLPAPASPLLARLAGQGLKVRGSALLGSDPDGDSLFLSAISPASQQGGTVSTNQGWIFYTPPAGLTNQDSFGYTVGDGRGGFSPGTVSIFCATNLAASLNVTWAALPTGQVRLRGDGIPLVNYSVEFAENLATPVWQFLGTVTADGFGIFEYLDTPPAGAPVRFYRTSCP